jgi:hypothetical protein
MPDECRSRLYRVRSLFTEELLVLSVTLDLPQWSAGFHMVTDISLLVMPRR